MISDTKIIMCETCTGSGVVHQRELEDPHRGEYKEWNEICTRCLGSGRLIKTTSIEINPYIPEDFQLSKPEDS